MTITQYLIKQLEDEGKTTRKMLEIVPDDKFGWKPHEKSMTIKRLATHIAELPGWIDMALNTDELDFANNPYQPEDVNTRAELLAYFDKTLADGKEKLAKADESTFLNLWTLRSGDQIYSKEPKIEVVRMAISQIIHHRAQLGVSLRLLNVPIPGSYGPSADESF